jgi:tetratricopeptide (TPR) repeat protein
MTHAESQELLLDLACGELDAERAAQVRSHLQGCAECRDEKAALDEVRRLAAPVRELEEPSPGFDDRILAAARAQAKLEHDGNVGEVIDVAGTIRPLGVEPARIDAHGPVKARPAERRRPRWVARAAVGGSVAAAAALAMVVGNSLETRRNAEKAAAARSEEYAIRVGPSASTSVDAALREAEAKRAKPAAQAPKAEPAAPPAAPPAPLEKEKLAQLRTPPRKAPRAAGGHIDGSGGDAPPKLASKDVATARRAKSDELRDSVSVPASELDRIGSSAGSAESQDRRRTEAYAGGSALGGAAAPPAAATEAAPDRDERAAGAAPAVTASGLESSAQRARHAGNYLMAASLYRRAAEARQQEKDQGSAAWALAHAVECLSAAGRFDEARQVREELARMYPSEATALSAARRALREVEPSLPAVR